MSDKAFSTRAIREHWWQSSANEHSQALFLTSSYTFNSAEEAADVFAERKKAFSYSRFGNPTVAMFEERLNHLEGGARCVAASTGMSAITALCMAFLEQGDHVVCARNCFGSTLVLFRQIIAKFGVSVSIVDLNDLEQWREACTAKTKLLFVETPANPLLDIADLDALAEIARDSGAKLVVDNCFATPYLQRPIEHGADIVIHSATKYIDGQGRAMGGALICRDAEDGDMLYRLLRTIGTTMSAFDAWIFLKSLETLALRMRCHSENALYVAQWLVKQPGIERVYYPGLENHPQHALAKRYMPEGFGGMVSFDVRGGQKAAWALIDRCDWLSISGNLGDARTIITHPDTTTHARVSDEDKAKMGISGATIRLSVGLEDAQDICQDLAKGFPSAS
ncbi:O-succinylhomoserine sulfhydrylase [Suttonella sp. R2A3]|uniref:O-succinylhomoserine sulfhydrylase n=1 Tax=Suttonella sp. R2A3 TaxID=2908648 RepID=UPI001F208B6D|nr:O-succinylhomoserine sulfhydrylase [Suttonella sp. R2A3]UJF24731.1 O-succinylhomoserine sulfhydrylase [Suttonella sp. R2A3]